MSDAHLRGIAERRPTTLRDLAACPGIGPLKLERYGEDLLALLERVSG
jgi:DNA helicase-2/ATP-dependent DNA helicase PcrA